MFASQITKTVDIPGDEPGEVVVVTIRKLNWHAIEAARDAASAKAMRTAATAGPDLMKMWGADAEAAKAKRDVDPNARYTALDRETILLRGIKSWTSEMPLAEGIADLDDPAADLLHRAIVDLSVPAAETAETARGNA